jgi:hypothetical protein
MIVHRLMFLVGFLSIALAAGACSADDASTSSAGSDTATISAGSTTTLSEDKVARVSLGNAFVDAFYSFDPEALEALFVEGTATGALYYQGFAEGANYRIVHRGDCIAIQAVEIICSITAEDDVVLAVTSELRVTDTFTLTTSDGLLTEMSTSSNDPEIVMDAVRWVFSTYPEIREGVCAGMWIDGETPYECARRIATGAQEYAEKNGITP